MRSLSTCFVVVAAAIVVVGSGATPDRRPPRIDSAAMHDADGDFRADRVRLTYSERVRHVSDRDGKYPFRVAGYKIRSVGPASGKTIVLMLVEKAIADDAARPAVGYGRTTAKPVKDRGGNQALGQVFRAVRAHGHRPTGTPPPPPPPPPGTDRDGDGVQDAQDCAPDNPATKPGAADAPDLAFVDSNCDGIDGTDKDAIFASPQGADSNPGTKAKPKRQIYAAVAAAKATGKDVYAAAGIYGGFEAASGVGIYGGYKPDSWARGFFLGTQILGLQYGISANGATGVVLQLLTVHAGAESLQGSTAYGIRLLNRSNLRLQRVVVTAADGRTGLAGANGLAGALGGDGGTGADGSCDGGGDGGRGGEGGASPVGRRGGRGGYGGSEGANLGQNGAMGEIGTPGGTSGAGGNPGKPGSLGASGATGAAGGSGSGGISSPAGATTFWVGHRGRQGTVGQPGEGGGGGGGGGAPGLGGGPGGGSFGFYLYNSSVTVTDGSSITSGNGGRGGAGGAGGLGGAGGARGLGGAKCIGEVGAGGDGGFGGSGGSGGAGGGAAGGPSVGIFKAGTSTATVAGGTKVANGSAGPGGTSPGNAGATGIAQPIYDAGP